MKRISVLMMSVMLVGAIAFTSCGSKQTKANAEAQSECCDKEKKDSTCCEKKDTCQKPCEAHDDASQAETEGME
ncbi:MAG: hypothetical protein AB7S54_12970 [Bacteroidales bacterium]